MQLPLLLVNATALAFHIFKTKYDYPFIFEHTCGHHKLCAIIRITTCFLNDGNIIATFNSSYEYNGA